MTDEERFKVEDKKKRAHFHEMGLDAVVDRLRMERRKRNLLPQTMFDLFDIDNNGSLSVEELEDAFRAQAAALVTFEDGTHDPINTIKRLLD